MPSSDEDTALAPPKPVYTLRGDEKPPRPLPTGAARTEPPISSTVGQPPSVEARLSGLSTGSRTPVNQRLGPLTAPSPVRDRLGNRQKTPDDVTNPTQTSKTPVKERLGPVPPSQKTDRSTPSKDTAREITPALRARLGPKVDRAAAEASDKPSSLTAPKNKRSRASRFDEVPPDVTMRSTVEAKHQARAAIAVLEQALVALRAGQITEGATAEQVEEELRQKERDIEALRERIQQAEYTAQLVAYRDTRQLHTADWHEDGERRAAEVHGAGRFPEHQRPKRFAAQSRSNPQDREPDFNRYRGETQRDFSRYNWVQEVSTTSSVVTTAAGRPTTGAPCTRNTTAIVCNRRSGWDVAP